MLAMILDKHLISGITIQNTTNAFPKHDNCLPLLVWLFLEKSWLTVLQTVPFHHCWCGHKVCVDTRCLICSIYMSVRGKWSYVLPPGAGVEPRGWRSSWSGPSLMCIHGYDRSLAVASVRDRGTSGRLSGWNHCHTGSGSNGRATVFFFLNPATLEATSRSESCSSSYDFQKEQLHRLCRSLHFKQWQMLIELCHFQLWVLFSALLFYLKINASRRPDATYIVSVTITLLLFISNVQWVFTVSDSVFIRNLVLGIMVNTDMFQAIFKWQVMRSQKVYKDILPSLDDPDKSIMTKTFPSGSKSICKDHPKKKIMFQQQSKGTSSIIFTGLFLRVKYMF